MIHEVRLNNGRTQKRIESPEQADRRELWEITRVLEGSIQFEEHRGNNLVTMTVEDMREILDYLTEYYELRRHKKVDFPPDHKWKHDNEY